MNPSTEALMSHYTCLRRKYKEDLQEIPLAEQIFCPVRGLPDFKPVAYAHGLFFGWFITGNHGMVHAENLTLLKPKPPKEVKPVKTTEEKEVEKVLKFLKSNNLMHLISKQ